MHKILLIDDEPHMLKLLERIITEKTAYKVDSTNSSLELPQLLEQSEYDLIITDLRMPGMDGMEIIDLVQKQNRWEKVVLITAFGSIDVALSAQTRGAFDYITKPFKKEQIVFVIERAMAFQKMRRELKELTDIFKPGPYDAAKAAFKKAFVKRVSDNCGGDKQKIAEITGLTSEEITDLLDK